MELLNSKLNIDLILWDTAKLFCKVAVPCCIPTANIWGLHLLYIFVNTLYYQTF